MGGPTDRRSRISGRSVQGRPYEGRPEFIPSSRVVTPAGQAVLAHVALRGPPVDGRRGGAHRGAGLPEPGAPWLLPPPPELPEDPPPVVVPPVDELPPVLPPPVVPPVVPPPEVPYEGLGSALGFGWGFGLGFGLALGLGAVHGSPGPISHRETRVHVKTSVPDSGCCRRHLPGGQITCLAVQLLAGMGVERGRASEAELAQGTRCIVEPFADEVRHADPARAEQLLRALLPLRDRVQSQRPDGRTDRLAAGGHLEADPPVRLSARYRPEGGGGIGCRHAQPRMVAARTALGDRMFRRRMRPFPVSAAYPQPSW